MVRVNSVSGYAGQQQTWLKQEMGSDGLRLLGSTEEFEAEKRPNAIEGFKDISGAEWRLKHRR